MISLKHFNNVLLFPLPLFLFMVEINRIICRNVEKNLEKCLIFMLKFAFLGELYIYPHVKGSAMPRTCANSNPERKSQSSTSKRTQFYAHEYINIYFNFNVSNRSKSFHQKKIQEQEFKQEQEFEKLDFSPVQILIEFF